MKWANGTQDHSYDDYDDDDDNALNGTSII